MKNIKIIEAPSEVGCAKLGASLGPAAIKIVAGQRKNDFFSRNERVTIPDSNSILSNGGSTTTCVNAKRISYVLEACQHTCNTVCDTLESGRFPVVLSADHSSAAGVIAGVKKAYEKERVGVVWIDAHSDLHTPFTTYSGNMHGMPLGAVLGLDAEARSLLNKEPNVLPESVQRQWTHLKELGGTTAKINIEDLILVGVRYFKPEHRAVIDDKNIKLYTVDDVRKAGGSAVADAINKHLSVCDRVFISFDVDSLDCDEVSRGTGTPEPEGLYLKEAIELVSGLMKNPQVIGLEIAEVNPLLDDKGNAMAEAAWELLEHCIVDA